MRLHELKPSHAKLLSRKKEWRDYLWDKDTDKRDTQEIASDISAWLKKRGYENIGSGFFSDVYKHPDSKIAIKFNVKPDRGYQAFTEYANKHRGNPHLPKMSPLHKIGKSNFIVFMEELKEWPHPPDGSTISTFFENLFYSLRNPHTAKDVVQRYEEQYPELSEEYSSFIQALVDVSLAALDHNASVDFKFDNIMQRPSDGHLVITDPWF